MRASVRCILSAAAEFSAAADLPEIGMPLALNISRGCHDRVGISGPTGDLGTAMAWLRPVALLQSSPPFGEWRGSGGKGPVLGWLLCSDAIPARSDEPEGGLTKPGRDGTCLRGTCMVQPRDARKIPLTPRGSSVRVPE